MEEATETSQISVIFVNKILELRGGATVVQELADIDGSLFAVDPDALRWVAAKMMRDINAILDMTDDVVIKRRPSPKRALRPGPRRNGRATSGVDPSGNDADGPPADG